MSWGSLGSSALRLALRAITFGSFGGGDLILFESLVADLGLALGEALLDLLEDLASVVNAFALFFLLSTLAVSPLPFDEESPSSSLSESESSLQSSSVEVVFFLFPPQFLEEWIL
jgi:hypothetical protein